jgi:hypothetical protein
MEHTRITHEMIQRLASEHLRPLIDLLNSETPLGEKVRGFIDKVRHLGGLKVGGLDWKIFCIRNGTFISPGGGIHALRDFRGSERDRLALASVSRLVRQINAEIGESRRTVTKLEWVSGHGPIWDISVSDGPPHDYKTWVWQVIDLGREGDLDYLGFCANAGCKRKVFVRPRRPRGAAEYCSSKCCQMAYRATKDYREKTNPSNRDYMRRKRTDDALMATTRGEWDHLKTAGYVYLTSGICRCGASIEWWRIPRRNNTRGIRPKITRLPLQKRIVSKGTPRVCSHLHCQRK